MKRLTTRKAQRTDGQEDAEAGASLRRPMLAGLVVIAITFGGFGTWAAVAPMATGATAQATVSVESRRKTVQHLEGGIVQEILVEEGDRVDKDQPLLRITDVRTQARLRVLQTRLAESLAREARLLAEKRDRETIDFPQRLAHLSESVGIAGIKADQRAVFEARREEMANQLEILDSRIGQLEDRIGGLREQLSASYEEKELIAEELESQETLYEKGHATRTRVLALQRRAAAIRGQVGSIKSQIAEAEARIGETRLQRIQLRQQRRKEIANQLTQLRSTISTVEEELAATQERVQRTIVRAPTGGQIVNMRVHTEGGVIGGGQPIMDIVPARDRLVLRGKLKPGDIDTVSEGMSAEVRITAFPRRTTPMIEGTVIRVAADATTDEKTGLSYYPIMVDVPERELSKLGDHELVAGMPATVMINAGEQTLLEYLTAPWTRAIEQSFRER